MSQNAARSATMASRPLVPEPTPAQLARYRDPARVAAFVRSLIALGVEIHIDPAAGRVDLVGAAVSPLLEEETRRRAATICKCITDANM